MLVLASLNKLLSQVLAPPAVHTAVLLTTGGELVSYVANGPHARTKDEVRVLVGLSSEVWAEAKDDGEGMVDSEMGKVLVLPVASPEEGRPAAEPVLLLVINATTDGVEWGELQLKGRGLATHLAAPLAELQEQFAVPPVVASTKGERKSRG